MRSKLKKRDKKSVEIVVTACYMQRLIAVAAGTAARVCIAGLLNFKVCAEKSDKKHKGILPPVSGNFYDNIIIPWKYLVKKKQIMRAIIFHGKSTVISKRICFYILFQEYKTKGGK